VNKSGNTSALAEDDRFWGKAPKIYRSSEAVWKSLILTSSPFMEMIPL
jgi:hypothetical protein